MKTTLLLLAVVVCASALTAGDKEWESFKAKFNKEYSAEEDARHYKIFNANKKMIEKHNKKFEEGKVTFKMGINKFADMTPSDTSYLRGYKSEGAEALRKNSPVFKSSGISALPASYDWRDYGYVTGVKDQGQCGSCWSFSATGSLEGQHFASTGDLVSLSEQNLVDCVQAAFGCNGGNMNGVCHYKAANRGATDTGSVVLAQSEDALQEAVATIGPISVAIDASRLSFQTYTGGVYYEEKCSSTNLDHGVLVVGYGTDGTDDYWLVKNSWGTSWGIDGYIKMARNRNNNCGIVTDASYPTV
ncbi:Cathepsin L [Armadillidium vulgare]|nr:Cathepsin L [Armadillidium vulgare]